MYRITRNPPIRRLSSDSRSYRCMIFSTRFLFKNKIEFVTKRAIAIRPIQNLLPL